MEEFLQKVRDLWKLKEEHDAADEIKKALSKRLEAAKTEVVKLMQVMEIEKQHIPDLGTWSIVKDYSLKQPATPEAKQELFDWIADQKGEDVLFNLLTINSATVKKFWNDERKAAIKAGDTSFKVPGLGNPEPYYKLRSLKA